MTGSEQEQFKDIYLTNADGRSMFFDRFKVGEAKRFLTSKIHLKAIGAKVNVVESSEGVII